MSLAVNKEIEGLKGQIEQTKKWISDELGFPIELEFEWASFKTPEAVYALKQNCIPMLYGDLSNMCKDQTSKDAVREGVKKVVIVQDDQASERKIELKDAVLTMKTEWINKYFGNLSMKEYLLKTL